MPLVSTDPRTTHLVQAYQRLTRDNLPALLSLYDGEVAFKDPFNEVRGIACVERIFVQMFDELHEPRFIVLSAATEGDDAFLTWEMRFARRAGGRCMAIRGATHLRYSSVGLVLIHRDYWDAAEELYAKLPVLGALMRALRRRLSTPT